MIKVLEEMHKQLTPAAKALGVDFYVSAEIYESVKDILIDGKFRGCKVINTGRTQVKTRVIKSKFHKW